MEAAGEQKAYYCFMFGLITFVVSFSYDLVARYLFGVHRDTEQWVFWKWMLNVLIILILIATGNFLFMWLEFDSQLSLKGFVGALTSTFLIGMFPVFFVGLLISHRAKLINQQVAQDITDKLQSTSDISLNLAPASSKERFELNPGDILFVESMQNYVVVYYENHQGHEQKILRSTLAAVEDVLHTTSVQRSHRSFLVNRDKIERVEGNAQGLKLSLRGVDAKKIPVSRRFIPNFQ